MNCNPTLTAQEFKNVHNGMCELASIIGQLEDTIHPSLLKKLLKAQTQIADGLKGAYEQDDKAFETKHEHYDNVRTDLGLQTVWSIYEVDNLNDRHPFEGATTVVYKDWNTNKDITVEVNGLTWAALYVAANAAMRSSTDNHHVYIEGFQQSSISPELLFLSTGS
jgi:hypothetical protein